MSDPTYKSLFDRAAAYIAEGVVKGRHCNQPLLDAEGKGNVRLAELAIVKAAANLSDRGLGPDGEAITVTEATTLVACLIIGWKSKPSLPERAPLAP